MLSCLSLPYHYLRTPNKVARCQKCHVEDKWRREYCHQRLILLLDRVWLSTYLLYFLRTAFFGTVSKFFISTFGRGRNQACTGWYESDKVFSSFLLPRQALTSLELESAKEVETHWIVKREGLGFLLCCALDKLINLLGLGCLAYKMREVWTPQCITMFSRVNQFFSGSVIDKGNRSHHKYTLCARHT